MSARRAIRYGRSAVLAVCSLALLASCQAGQDRAAPGPADRVAGPVVVASFNFPESELLAAIYGLAIRHAGIPVRFQLDLGPRELVQPALEQGLADVVPEYLGTALTSLEAHPGVPMTNPPAVRAALARAQARWHVRVMTPAAAQDQNGIAVTAATARRLGLSKVSDLQRAAGKLTRRGAGHHGREPRRRRPDPALRRPAPAARRERGAGDHRTCDGPLRQPAGRPGERGLGPADQPGAAVHGLACRGRRRRRHNRSARLAGTPRHPAPAGLNPSNASSPSPGSWRIRLSRRLLQFRRGATDVAGDQELPEDLPHPLCLGSAEADRGQVRQAEPEVVARLQQAGRDGPADRVRVD